MSFSSRVQLSLKTPHLMFYREYRSVYRPARIHE